MGAASGQETHLVRMMEGGARGLSALGGALKRVLIGPCDRVGPTVTGRDGLSFGLLGCFESYSSNFNLENKIIPKLNINLILTN